MDYKLSIYFINGKDLTVILKESEFSQFLDDMGKHRAYWNDDKKSGFGVPLFNILYYTFIEYTEELKKADTERINKAKEEATKEPKQEEAAKEIKE